jgi:type III restriction enzyme
MPLINLKPYQANAVEELSAKLHSLLQKQASNKICVFKSPTGSGKTVIVAKLIENLVNNYQEHDLCFLWVSIGKGDLHIQSKNSLDRIFEGSPHCTLLENDFIGSRTEIARNEVVVVNWEKIRSKNSATGEWKNKVMQSGETESFIDILSATCRNRKIIMIIDESHYASDTALTKELREIIAADVTLEMSATPKIAITQEETARGTGAFVLIEPNDVIEAGMIKKEVIINEGISDLVSDESTSQEVILEAAYRKRLRLQELYAAQGVDLVPLVLVQLPNSEQGDTKRESVENFLASKGITEDNGKLAVWFSGEKSDFLDRIAENNDSVEFLLFKQAIDTGWDCPRAQILVKLRDIQSFVFEVQTLGRILRMPEQKHYLEDELNIGYVYTNLKSIDVAREEFNPNMVKHLLSRRKSLYQSLGLKSYYRSRIDYGDITYSFQPILDKIFSETFDISVDSPLINIAENMDKFRKMFETDISDLDESIFSNVQIRSDRFDSDFHASEIQNASKIELKLSEIDIYETFNQLIKLNLQGFAPRRSIPSVRQAVYVWCKRYLGMSLNEGGVVTIQKIFLHPQNIETFGLALAKAIEAYRPIKQAEILARVQELTYDWDIKELEYYNQHSSVLRPYLLSIYEPSYGDKDPYKTESAFEEFLENHSDSVSWWYKNGINMKDYLGIKYVVEGIPRTFYPDYLISLKSGMVIIGDTKAGITASEAKPKALALQKYLNSMSDQVSGGIFIQDKTGRWRVNLNPKASFELMDLSKWAYLDELMK